MNLRTSPRKWFTGWLGLALCLALSLPATPAAGEDRYWIGGSGFWSEDANWSPYGQPINGDNVYLTQSDATSRMVNHYNWRYPGAVANNLRIDCCHPPHSTISKTENRSTARTLGRNPKTWDECRVGTATNFMAKSDG